MPNHFWINLSTMEALADVVVIGNDVQAALRENSRRWLDETILLSTKASGSGLSVNWSKAEQLKYIDSKTGLPIAPKSVRDLLKRTPEQQQLWQDAMKKEVDGLKKRGVYTLKTMRELRDEGSAHR